MIDESYLEKVVTWAGSVFLDGYTPLRGRGNFDGLQEDSLVLSAIMDRGLELEQRVVALKNELGQKSILFSRQDIDARLV